METRKFNGKNVSLLGFGAMRLPRIANEGSKIDFAEAKKCIDTAFENGVNYFDTAYMYHDGESESFIGAALAERDRESYFLTTKLPIWEVHEKNDMDKIFDTQLRRTNAEYFDFYLCHALNAHGFDSVISYDAYEFLQKKKREGKIRAIGFSFHDSPAVLERIVRHYDWEVAQIQLNYLDWVDQNAAEQYAILEKANIPCIVMEPLRGGALANLTPEANKLLSDFAPDMSIASWALRFAASRKGVLTVLSGMSSFDQVQDNIKTFSNFTPLSAAEEKLLEKAAQIYRRRDVLPCTDCRYCCDCPQGLEPPEIFKIYNLTFAINHNKDEFVREYSKLPENKKAYNCVKCKKCETHCPQLIKISEKLSEINSLSN
ncbi:MAG: aldo/keto reductase [Clostridia bacterium]|nr:aldo/keto reductase [Clostridia bacterium]